MAHEQINTFPVGPGAIQFGFKGVAAFVRGMVQFQSLHNIRPKYPVLGLIANLPVVADQPGATFSKPPFNQGPDLWMDGNNAVLTGFRLVPPFIVPSFKSISSGFRFKNSEIRHPEYSKIKTVSTQGSD